MDSINSGIDRSIKAYEEFQTKRSITSNVISLLLKEPRVQQDDKLKRELYAKYEDLRIAESEWAARQTEFERAQNQVSQLRQEAMTKANDAGQVCCITGKHDEFVMLFVFSIIYSIFLLIFLVFRRKGAR